MSTYKELLPSDVKTAKSFLTQVVDVTQEDVSSSSSRRAYEHFVTGGVGPGVTSSLYQTVYDQDFTLATTNAIFDITVGLKPTGDIVTACQTGTDAAGKQLFPSSSLMMREKMDIYRQFAKSLLGDVTETFSAPFNSSDTTDEIDAAMFINFKRLFSRDAIKRETFALRFYTTASAVGPAGEDEPAGDASTPNLYKTSERGGKIFTDVGSSVNKLTAFGGQVGNIVDASDSSQTVGLMFYDRGVAVFDLEKITSGSQFVSGTIDAMNSTGQLILGAVGTETALTSKFIPDFITSASIDNIVDHLCGARFQSGSLTACAFQNVTNINSTLYFCRASADEFNYSSNPTYVDSSNKIVVIDAGQEDVQTAFSFVTGVGLYSANNELLATGKVSRPIEKSNERDLTLRLRIDY